MAGGTKITDWANSKTRRTKSALGVGCETVRRRCSERFLKPSSYSFVVGALAGGSNAFTIGNLRARRTADARLTNLRLIDRTTDALKSLPARLAADAFALGSLLINVAVGDVADGLTLAFRRVILVTSLTVGDTSATGTVFDLTLGAANRPVASPAEGTGRTTDSVRGVCGAREGRSALGTVTLAADSTAALAVFVNLTTRTTATVGRSLMRVASGGATLAIGGTRERATSVTTGAVTDGLGVIGVEMKAAFRTNL